jgi:fibronectin-binding autotransporter adhesin
LEKALVIANCLQQASPVNIRLILGALGIATIGAATLQAQTDVWNGGGGANTNWSDTSNWASGTPANNDTVQITFTNPSAYTSTVDTSYSVINVQVSGTAGALILTNSGGATLTLSSGFFYGGTNSVTVNVPILGAGNFWLNGGTGTVTIGSGSGLSTYSGSTEIFGGGTLTDTNSTANSFSSSSVFYVGGTGGGTLDVLSNETIAGLNDGGANGLVNVANGKILTLTGAFSSTYSGVIAGAGGLTMNGPSTQTLDGANTYTGPTVINSGGSINIGGGGATGSIASNSISGAGGISFDLSGTYTYAGNLSGALSVAQQGTGTTTLTGVNSYTGATTINSGTLQAGSSGVFGNQSPVTINGSGILNLGVFSNTIGSLASAGTTSSVIIGSGATLTVGNSATPTIFFNGTISGAGALTYNNLDGNVFLLTGANTYTGTTDVNNGTLLVENSSGSGIGTGPITIGSGAVLQIGNVNTFGSIGAGAIMDDGTFTLTRTDTNTYSNSISGFGSVDVDRGVVTLSGNNTYAGVTSVFNSTLNAGSITAVGSGTLDLSTGAIFNLNGFNLTVSNISSPSDPSTTINLGSNTLTLHNVASSTVFEGLITGTGALNVQVIANLDLTGTGNTYSGGTTVSSGAVIADNTAGNALGTGMVSIGGGGTLAMGNDSTTGYIANVPITDNGTLLFQRTDSTTFPNSISGAGNVEAQDGGTTTLTGTNTYSGLTDANNATLIAGAANAFGSGAGALDLANGGIVNLAGFNNAVGSITGNAGTFIQLGSGTLTDGSIGGLTIYGGVISGVGGLTMSGPGTQALEGANTYTGPTSVGAGSTLEIGWNSSATGGVTTSGVSGAGTLEFSLSVPATYSFPLTGALNVKQAGTGTSTLTGANTYSGTTTVTQGTLAAGNNNVLGNGSSIVSLTGGILSLGGFSETVGSITGAPSAQIQLGSGTLTSNTAGFSAFSGVISGTAGSSLVLGGGGTLTLTGGNTFSGTTSIAAGNTLFVGDGSTFGARIVGNVTDNGSLLFAPSGTDNFSYAGAISGTGTFGITGPGIVTFAGANSYAGTTSIGNGSLTDTAGGGNFSPTSNVLVSSSGGQLAVIGDETVGNLENGGTGGPVSIAVGKVLTSLGQAYGGDFEGVVSGGGGIEVSSGQQGFSGNNTFSGGTLVSGTGELWIGSNSALGTGTLTFNGTSTEMSPDANVILSNAIVVDSTLDNDDGGPNDLTLTGPISGPSGITWCTTGTLTLNNPTNSFSGGIDMRLGTLVAGATGATGTNAIILDTATTLNVASAATVANALNFTGTGATLAGNGTISTLVNVNSGVILSPSASPGGGPGTLSFGNIVDFSPGGTFNFNVYDATGTAGVGYNSITAAAGLNFASATAGSLTFNISSIDINGNAANALNFSAGNSYSWTFATTPTAIASFSTNQFVINRSGFLNSVGGMFSISQVGNNLDLNFSPVPEPSTWALIGSGVIALGLFGVRRRIAAKA